MSPRRADLDVFLDYVPEDPSESIGGAALRTVLGWDEAKFDRVVGLAQAGGLITVGRGRGGSYRRVLSTKVPDGGAGAPGLVSKEEELIEPFRQAWFDSLATEQASFCEVYDTHSLGGHKMGKWSRPDATAVEVMAYEYLPVPQVTISTYELKRRGPQTEWITGALEAASHHRWAHRASLVIERSRVDEPKKGVSEELLAIVRRFRLGLYRVVRSPKGKGFMVRLEEIVEPGLVVPEVEHVNERLDVIFGPHGYPDEREEYRSAIGLGES